MAADRHRRPGLLLVASRCPRGRFALPAEAKSVSGPAHAPVRGGNDWISDSAARSPPHSAKEPEHSVVCRPPRRTRIRVLLFLAVRAPRSLDDRSRLGAPPPLGGYLAAASRASVG